MTIVCIISPFAFEQKVVLYNDDGTKEALGTIPLEDVPQLVAENCYTHKATKVHLYGQESYVEPLISEIMEYSIENYLNKNITFEVN